MNIIVAFILMSEGYGAWQKNLTIQGNIRIIELQEVIVEDETEANLMQQADVELLTEVEGENINLGASENTEITDNESAGIVVEDENTEVPEKEDIDAKEEDIDMVKENTTEEKENKDTGKVEEDDQDTGERKIDGIQESEYKEEIGYIDIIKEKNTDAVQNDNEVITEDEKENENLDIVTDTKEDMGEVKSE